MGIKPRRSRTISVVKGQFTDEKFYNGEAIPTVWKQPIKSLRRLYSMEFKDTQEVEQLR